MSDNAMVLAREAWADVTDIGVGPFIGLDTRQLRLRLDAAVSGAVFNEKLLHHHARMVGKADELQRIFENPAPDEAGKHFDSKKSSELIVDLRFMFPKLIDLLQMFGGKEPEGKVLPFVRPQAVQPDAPHLSG